MYQLTHPVNAAHNLPRGVWDKENPFDLTAVTVFIPLDMGNTDCVNFIAAWKAGASVVDNTGTLVAYDEATITSMGLTPAP